MSSILNEVTGSEVNLRVHPYFPQGNALIRSVSLPIPNSNISETSAMAMVQDYTALQFPVIQLAYEMATYQIGTLVNYAPSYSGVISGIAGTNEGVPQTPPSFSDN